ncbi:MAG: TonB-dependent receptor [Calditrichaeota bacterium]|nr:TonB-dependent receptor [Calditrichota bacterium]
MLDYKLPIGKISLTNFASSGITTINNRYETININANSHNYQLGYSKSTLNMMTNTLGFDGQLPIFHADIKLSHSYSENKRPDDWEANFYQTPAGINQFANKKNLDPKTVAAAVYTKAGKTKLNTISTNDNMAQERALTFSLDLDRPINFSKKVTSVIKFGGKYRIQRRSYESEVYGTNATLVSPSAQGATRMIIDEFGVPTNDPTAIPLSFFVDENFDYGELFGGDYEMHHPMDFGMISDLVDFCQDNVDEFAKVGGKEAFARNNFLSVTNNYSGDETLTAGYLMATINVGQKLTIIPGIRYQNLRTKYSGTRGQQTPLSYLNYNHDTDTTVTVNHPFWLPNLNIRYKPLSWFDVRLSYSQTISYPDFNTIIPRIDASMGADVAWNNYELKPSRSKNYDLYFSFFKNAFGLFTVGGFWKQIDDLIYPWRFSVPGTEAAPYYLTNKTPSPQITYNISTYVNNPFVTNNYGVEFDWQTHFWYLPDPLKGLVFNVNYTHVHSEAKYPYVRAGAVTSANVDTSFTDRLIDQPNHIVNLSLGYDYKGFSIRVSMLYQDDVFTGPSQWPQLRSSTASYKRWDLSVKQNLPWWGIQIYGDVNNLNGAQDMSVLQMYPKIPRTMEKYGMTADIGFRFQI